ncbi:Imm74 family immunity protein [Myroides fluvii]|uniref:Imm74 family immunity protein n=1 Tax=Myroides fluvii TaxID=2572594 RepID=UPI00131AB97B|nr:Imm74 family immunity protein [Myroides fluvii]
MKVEYSILTPSTMKIIVDNKKEMYIQGEGTTEPKFYADIDSIKNWEPPYEQEPITENEKKEIISSIEKASKKGKIPIVFD